jgi:DNA adenine methylase
MSAITQPIKIHGGKHYLAQKIITLMPPRTEWCHYVEPYFGGGSVLLAKDPHGVSEVANDINGELMNFWRVLQRQLLFDQFKRLCEATPFSEAEYRHASAQGYDYSDDPVLAAWQFFIRCRQSLAGRMKGFATLSRNRTRRNMNEQASAWITAIEGLAAVHERLQRVVILNHEALDVIREQDGDNTLFYFDPPYLHETRSTTDAYAHEMTKEQHRQLLEVIININFRGKVMLSGYESALYSSYLCDWNVHKFQIPNSAAGGAKKQTMTEHLWCNF